MSLSKLLNDAPRYDATLPSNGEVVKYRPFLVKEQKVLMIAAETKDSKQMITAMIDCVNNCTQNIDAKKLPTYDLDHLFLQIRSKSIGETAKISTTCGNCQNQNIVDVKLTEIKFDNNIKDNEIKLSDKVMLKMKPPTYEVMLNNEGIFTKEDISATEILFETMALCMDSVTTDEENISLKDETKEEISNFIDSFSNDQLKLVTEYIESLPKASYEEEFICKSCENKNVFKLNGIQDFF